MQTAYVTLDDPKLPWPKVGSLRCSDEGIEVECLICEKPLKVHQNRLSKYYGIIDVFCSNECLQQGHDIPPIPAFDAFTTKSKRGPCEACGGPPKCKGWDHADSCSARPRSKLQRKCPECDGIARGRGFIHMKGCSQIMGGPKKVKIKRLCPECAGPARGRGFIHQEGCKL